jgi:hypothetical protein
MPGSAARRVPHPVEPLVVRHRLVDELNCFVMNGDAVPLCVCGRLLNIACC